MPRSRGPAHIYVSVLLSITLAATPIWGSSGLGLGTVVSADRAHVSAADASVGTTIFPGDTLDTERGGSLQVRIGAARILLSGGARVLWAAQDASPTATLTTGTVAFSTAKADAFSLHAGTAVFRPKSDEPTVANVTLLSPKELLVRCSRGAILIAVEDDIRVIPEGSAYRVVLDPELAARAAAMPSPDPIPSGQNPNPPLKTGKSKFVLYAIIFTGIVSAVAIYKALESPDGP